MILLDKYKDISNYNVFEGLYPHWIIFVLISTIYIIFLLIFVGIMRQILIQ